ncbi:hypothetical protein KQI82_12815 [Oscillibacter sp. MSJ-2]|uniref:Uncharacterized protein n=1 Tax=Dysosmobacter acutus TaxID=2841504 RepID=A0ABS6FCB6_9FIRM|nr:hypothetical protein [Dysosmobacter acutus]MBU5627792.1 hypothetical protein [Dysosmobacter acutus]
MFKKREHEGQAKDSERVAWETDKNVLSQNKSEDGKISIGYATHSIEDYQELVPMVLDVMDELLKDCTVFTWMRTPTYKAPHNGWRWFHRKALRGAPKNFAKQYAREASSEIFFDGDAEILVKTQGANRALMERFYQIPDCATAYQHTVYGFYKSPQIRPQSTYEEVHYSIVHPLADYMISYLNFHVELVVTVNLSSVSEADVLNSIQKICLKHGKK